MKKQNHISGRLKEVLTTRWWKNEFIEPPVRNKNEKKNLKDTKIDEYQIEMTPSAVSIGDAPDDSFQLINKYGTYEIQPTANTENDFPAIAQGTPKYMAERPLEFFRDEDNDNPASDMSGKHCL